MKLSELDAFMSDWAKPEYSMSWDNDGIMLDADGGDITRVTVALEINEAVIESAVRFGANAIVTHHPFVFHPLKAVRGVPGQYIKTLMKHSVSVLSYHTRLDCADGGVNDTLARRLGLSDVKPFGHDPMPLGRVGMLPREMNEKELAEHVKAALSCGTLRGNAVGKDKIRRVAVVGGGGKDEIADACAVADAFVTADLSHNAFITASELSLFVLDAGHYHTENPVIFTIAERLQSAFPSLAVETSDAKCPFALY